MKMMGPLIINRDSISLVWYNVLNELISRGIKGISDLTVSININQGQAVEDNRIKEILDTALEIAGKPKSDTTAKLIFPFPYWDRNQRRDRHQFYTRYLRALPHLKQSDHRNKLGTYFERMISYTGRSRIGHNQSVNQLETVIQNYIHGVHRQSALQIAIFDPVKDHAASRQRGFPCLQHVFLSTPTTQTLTITGIYATQYVFDRAYGNYLGLFYLGEFLAREMNLTLTTVNCFSNQVELGSINKSNARVLYNQMSQIYNE